MKTKDRHFIAHIQCNESKCDSNFFSYYLLPVRKYKPFRPKNSKNLELRKNCADAGFSPRRPSTQKEAAKLETYKKKLAIYYIFYGRNKIFVKIYTNEIQTIRLCCVETCSSKYGSEGLDD